MGQSERRNQILEAFLKLVARGGIAAVNLRTVALEAGCSLGMVQRRFPSKDALLEAAIAHSVGRLERRLRPLPLSDGYLSARQFLERVLTELTLTTLETRGETVIWLSVLEQAVIVPEYAQHLRCYYQPAQGELAEIIAHGQRTNEFNPQLEPLETAISLLALADGLTLQLQIGSITAQQAQAVLICQLEMLAAIA